MNKQHRENISRAMRGKMPKFMPNNKGINQDIPSRGGAGKLQDHPTQKPVELMEHLIKIHSLKEHTVLDPFMGSGTTGIACRMLRRKFIGIEIDKTYFDIAKQRIQNAQKELF